MSLTADRAGSTRLFQRPEAPGAQLQLIYFPGSVLFGRCTLANLGNLVRPFGEKAFLVTYGQGRTSKAGVAQRVKESLASAGIESVVYEIKAGPLLDTIDEGAVQLRASGAAFVVGAGGGSVLDSAKAIAALAANEGKWEDYQLGRRVLTAQPLPIVAVPTTAGTGSEATAVAVVGNPEQGIIKSVTHPMMLPRLVILDPELTASVPPQLTALVGLDAFIHAMESYVSPKASPITENASLQALRLLAASLLAAVMEGQNMEARGDVLLASHLAGQALNAGVGAAHILAQPISAVLGIGHPNALSTVLEPTVAYNEDYAADKYRRIVEILKPDAPSDERPSHVVGQFVRDLGLDQKLSDYGGSEADIPRILHAVVRSTGHIWTNPRPVTLDALEQILRAAL
jgi:alcohol dehydrogenase class IV